ncbi:von Willebrand factor type A domain-containing protein [Zalerion maritima]|uniref:von Willebrand factor type A domain-containing protein n=1 Tax=Zalerion maritima TaxID=339359 RepID=A0AAD5WSF3_9PEZI|nr:von Willebrand factor type A domain-containing protein [Zalerion maritima]
MAFSTAIALGCALLGVGPALAQAGVSPALVSVNGDPGLSFEVDKIVTTLEIPPTPDVVLVIDTTGSMGPAINDVKSNLVQVIAAVGGDSQFGVVSYRDLRDADGFTVHQDLTSNDADVQSAVNSLAAGGGRGPTADWINALYEVSTGAVTFRGGSSRIVVLVGDQPSFDPSGGHALGGAIDALRAEEVRVIAVNIDRLDADGQATDVTADTGGVIVGSAADAVTDAIISGLQNIHVTVKPAVSCDDGLSIDFEPPQSTVSSGADATFLETVTVADGAVGALSCSTDFLLNGAPGGSSFVQTVNVTVSRLGCDVCDPGPGRNLCHATTSCAPTPFGTMCLTRPGYKADGAADDDARVQWRLEWPVPGHEHRVAVAPGTSADTLCDEENKGPDVCKEVKIANCATAELGVAPEDDDAQKVQGDEEL